MANSNSNTHEFMEKCKEAISDLLEAVQDPIKKFNKDQQNTITLKANKILVLMGHIAIELTETKARLAMMDKPEIASTAGSVKADSYASSAGKMRYIQKKNEYCVLISPKQNNNDSMETLQKKIQEKIKIGKLRINVDGFKKISNNRLIIKCFKREDATKLQKEISKEIKDVETKELEKKKPTLVFKGIYNDYNKEEFIEDLIEQNEYLKYSSDNKDINSLLNVKKVVKNKFNDTSNYIVEVDKEVRRMILQREKINIGYQRIYVEDANPIFQCYHCLRFGHTAVRCLQKDKDAASCTYCGDAHTHNACGNKNKSPKCKNCEQHNLKNKWTFPSNHRANDRINCNFY